MKNLNEGYEIPNFGKDLSIPEDVTSQSSKDNVMLKILNNLNESEDMSATPDQTTDTKVQEDDEEKEMVTCPKCGAQYDKANGECPNCHEACEDGSCEDDDKNKAPEKNESIHRSARRRLHEDDEDFDKKDAPIKESAHRRRVNEDEDTGVTPEEIKKPYISDDKKIAESCNRKKLHEDDESNDPQEKHPAEVKPEDSISESKRYSMARTLLEYYRLCEAEDFDKAKEVLEVNDATVNVDADGVYEIKETVEDKDDIDPEAKDKISEGDEVSLQMDKDELKKVDKVEESFSRRRRGSKSINESYRPTSTHAKARRAIYESVRKSQLVNSIQRLAMNEGITFSTKALRRAINEGYRINEDEILLPDQKAEDAIDSAFTDSGVDVKNIDTEKNDGVLTAHVTLGDNKDAQVYLGDVADKVADELKGKYDVEYDDPKISEADDDEVAVDFHLVPIITQECDDQLGKLKKEDESEEDDEDQTNLKKTNEDDEEDEEDQTATKKTNEDDEEDDEDKKDTSKVNESIFESYAGGATNIRAKINPAFIKPGQIIYDADDQTVFKALTESVHNKSGYSVSIDVFNSNNYKLKNATPGTEATLTSRGNYFLLKSNPFED